MYAMELDGRYIGSTLKWKYWGTKAGKPVEKTRTVPSIKRIIHDNVKYVTVHKSGGGYNYTYSDYVTSYRIPIDTEVEVS